MAKYIWLEEYSVGIKEIDEQHKHFFKLANDVVELANSDRGAADELMFELSNLNGYASYHLATEENIFARYKYPDTRVHVKAHDAYRENMKLYMHAVGIVWPDTKTLARTTAEFAGNWLAKHILGMDQKYVKFMHEAGLS